MGMESMLSAVKHTARVTMSKEARDGGNCGGWTRSSPVEATRSGALSFKLPEQTIETSRLTSKKVPLRRALPIKRSSL